MKIKHFTWIMIQVFLVIGQHAFAQVGLYLESEKGDKQIQFVVGQTLEFFYDKPTDCEQCQNCNYYQVKGEYVGLKNDKVLLVPMYTENSSVKDGKGKLEQVEFKYPDDAKEQFSYSLNGVTSVSVYTKSRDNARTCGGLLIGASLLNNLIIAPLVAYDFGAKEMNGSQYMNLAIPGWIAFAGGITLVSIPIKKEYKLNAERGRTWKLLKN